jgi:carbon-monoxide dehydrogenase large subunit
MSHAYGSLPRKEDPRFLKGQGTFIDDVALPGMLHGAILRSPLAHARIVSVDATAARAHPMVVAVLTGADLAERGLAWMPTLFGDVQSVLATDKVRFQGQEIAFVVATDRYAARDALELIAVDYEPLPPLMDALTALEPGAPAVREDRRRPTRPSPRPMSWSSATCSTRARTRPRSRPAARSPSTTRPAAG